MERQISSPAQVLEERMYDLNRTTLYGCNRCRGDTASRIGRVGCKCARRPPARKSKTAAHRERRLQVLGVSNGAYLVGLSGSGWACCVEVGCRTWCSATCCACDTSWCRQRAWNSWAIDADAIDGDAVDGCRWGAAGTHLGFAREKLQCVDCATFLYLVVSYGPDNWCKPESWMDALKPIAVVY